MSSAGAMSAAAAVEIGEDLIAAAEVHYRPRGRVGGLRVGAHPSPAQGSLGTFRDQVPFMSHPDARRIDVRATFRDPFGGTIVRRFRQRAAIDVVVLADVSGSLAYEGAGRKQDLMIATSVALARAATRIGDRFGLYVCHAAIRDDCTVALTRRPGIVADVATRLRRAACAGTSAAGLLQAADRLTGARKMVFVVSDFFLPDELLSDLFERLSRHDTIPVVIADTTETDSLPERGLVELTDLESRQRRLVLMRPSLKARWLEAVERQRARLVDIARRYGRAPVVVTDRFDADQFSRQLLEA